MKETKFLKLTEDEFDAKYTILPNHITGNESFGGMFETYGEEVDYIVSLANSKSIIDNRRVWTILECDGVMFYSSGFHFVNRYGYLVTAEAVPEGEEIEVELENLTEEEN